MGGQQAQFDLGKIGVVYCTVTTKPRRVKSLHYPVFSDVLQVRRPAGVVMDETASYVAVVFFDFNIPHRLNISGLDARNDISACIFEITKPILRDTSATVNRTTR